MFLVDSSSPRLPGELDLLTLNRLINGKFVPEVVEVRQGNKTGLDTLQPVTGWWMYWLKDEEELQRMEAARKKQEALDWGYDWDHDEL